MQNESSLLYRRVSLKMLDYDAFLMHGAVVAMDGEAYLFTAKSGVGKSTHAQYWIEAFGERAHILNGDKPIIRIIDNEFYACGTPWRGKERIGTAECMKLKAIYLLARGKENEVTRASIDDVTEKMLGQTLIPEDAELLEKHFALLNRLIENVPIYNLKCNMSPEAARVAYEGARM